MKHFYIETNQPHILVWPVIAISRSDEFWVGIGWLNFELGWRKNNA